MKLSFATLGCPRWNLKQIADNAKSLGYDGVELRGAPGEHIGPDETPESRRAIRQLFEKHQIEVASIMGYSTFTLDDPVKQQQSIDDGLKFVEVARDVGCPVLRIFAGKFCQAGREESLRRVIEGVKRVAGKAEKFGVRLAIETHDDWCKGENLRAVLAGVRLPVLGICWDVGNSFFAEPLRQTHAAIHHDIAHVHYKDGKRDAAGKEHSVLPGTGEVDMPLAMRLLHDGGYKGYLSFEWEKKWQPELAEPEVAFPHYIKYVTGLMEKLGVPRG